MTKNKELVIGARKAESVFLTGHERRLAHNDIIVSKTDERGKITYVNKIFIDISDYTEEEMLGAPHSAIRHPKMPRAVFKLLWDTIGSGKEIFAYVINRCKNGDHYWVLAHVTPSYTLDGKLLGYHSNRRAPREDAIAIIKPLYDDLYAIEQRSGRKDGITESSAALKSILDSKGITYDKFILSI